ncbi:hypothetical protein Nos7107_0528 [Nostoc sp. PCC 7107]|nr:hypothetical protein Nos7107_0528 [Nostoc sp. PCC 7107]
MRSPRHFVINTNVSDNICSDSKCSTQKGCYQDVCISDRPKSSNNYNARTVSQFRPEFLTNTCHQPAKSMVLRASIVHLYCEVGAIIRISRKYYLTFHKLKKITVILLSYFFLFLKKLDIEKYKNLLLYSFRSSNFAVKYKKFYI